MRNWTLFIMQSGHGRVFVAPAQWSGAGHGGWLATEWWSSPGYCWVL